MVFWALLLVVQTGSVPAAGATPAVAEPGAPGGTQETALKVDGLDAEYTYLKKNMLRPTSQSLILGQDGHPYDVIDAVDPNGAKRRIWFDIQSFYGKGFGR